jgi:hypothetical protein
VPARYDARRDSRSDGWTVYDVETGHPAEVNGSLQVGLPLEDADDLADLLNGIDAKRAKASEH